MPLYQINDNGSVAQIKPATFTKERDLQRLFERNLACLFGVHFLASEFTTGDRQRGRIDTLGLDQDGYPTIIEYKKTANQNIINQGLFYLDWLVDHKGDFTLAVQKALGNEAKIDWGRIRVILVAENFSEYDKYAVNRIGANIELWAFRKYGDGILYLDPLFTTTPLNPKPAPEIAANNIQPEGDVETQAPALVYELQDHTQGKAKGVIEIFEQFRERVLALADEGEILEKPNKMYVGYKHGKNFCEVRLQTNGLKIWLDIPYSELDDPFGLARDVSKLGHYGTGAVETKLSEPGELDKVMALVEQSFQQTI